MNSSSTSSDFHKLLHELSDAHNSELEILHARIAELEGLSVTSQTITDVDSVATASQFNRSQAPIANSICVTELQDESPLQKDKPIEPLPSPSSYMIESPELWPIWHKDKVRVQLPVMPNYTSSSSRRLHRGGRNEIGLQMAGICPMSPSSSFRMVWDVWGMITLLFDLIWIPMEVFGPPAKINEICGWVVVVYWTADIFATFNVGYVALDGRVEYRLAEIAKNYLKGFFFFDLFIVTTDWVMIIFGAFFESDVGQSLGIMRTGKIYRVIRIFRTFRLLRLMKLRQLVTMIWARIDSESMAIVLAMAKNTAVLLLLNHYIACLWYWLGTSEGGGETWVEAHGIGSENFGTKYIMALHWSLTQFTPASVDIQPRTFTERVFAVAVLACGMLIFSSFVSSNTSAMTRLWNLRAVDATKFFMLRAFLKENQISPLLSARVRRYIDLAEEAHKKTPSMEQVELLKMLSGPLNIDLHRELYEPRLLYYDFFLEYNVVNPAMNQLCFTAISSMSMSKGDMLFEPGSKAYCMFFVSTGSLYYQPAKINRGELGIGIQRLTKVNQGHYFCEGLLWCKWVHRGKMRALIECSLLRLDGNQFQEVSAAYPEALQLAATHAHTFVKELKALAARGKCLWDLPGELMHNNTMTQCTEEIEYAEELEAELMELSNIHNTGGSGFISVTRKRVNSVRSEKSSA